ncbi:hypothetical protein [Novipirellula aureliae]|uniref:hypothetical protein n=1 Tax=Novipirellula aureliae TaxID=2527966 RepID=UPI0011B3E225|nr:hypothetical protein [Novipirellula aureliae]
MRSWTPPWASLLGADDGPICECHPSLLDRRRIVFRPEADTSSLVCRPYSFYQTLRASGSWFGCHPLPVDHTTGKDVSVSGLWGDGATIHGSKAHATGSGCFGLRPSSAEEQLT